MKIIELKKYKTLRDKKNVASIYRLKIEKMDKPALLVELLNYNDHYRKDPNDLEATLKAQALMDVLERRAELNELKELSQEFNQKLKTRLYKQIQDIK
jgi:hypothetical protein